MITIRTFGMRTDAESAVIALEAEGIEARIVEEPVFGAAGVSQQGIQLQVADLDAARASALLSSFAPLQEVAKVPDSGFLRGGAVGVALFVAASYINEAGGGEVTFSWSGMGGVFVLGGICGMCWWPAIASQRARRS